jgi:hypothetical protein
MHFKSEIDAKIFAAAVLSKGWNASAGTLNPHEPRKIIGLLKLAEPRDASSVGK